MLTLELRRFPRHARLRRDEYEKSGKGHDVAQMKATSLTIAKQGPMIWWIQRNLVLKERISPRKREVTKLFDAG